MLTRWNPDVTDLPPDGGRMFDTLEHLDFQDPEQYARALKLRQLELPFVVVNTPNMLEVVDKWADTNSLLRRFGDTAYGATSSHANHLMYYRGRGRDEIRNREEWNAVVRGAVQNLGHEEDDNLQPAQRPATRTKGEAEARAKGYTYRHPPPIKSSMTFGQWVQNNVELRSRVERAANEISRARTPAGTVPGTIAEAAAALPDHPLRPYFGAALTLLHRSTGTTAAAPADGKGGGEWPWWWWPLNATDVNAAQWYPRAYLEFGDDHDDGQKPPGQDIHLFRSKEHNPATDLFLSNRGDIRGLHCRFGTAGTIAEAHWDGHLNYVAMLGGAKRYILTPPSECKHLAIMPDGPSARHVGYDGSDLRTLYTPGLESCADYAAGRGLETVLRQGEVLYIPSYWVHWIVSLTDNYQCNCRSGTSPTALADLESLGICLTPEDQRPPDWKSAVQPQRWWETPQNWHAEEEAAAMQEVESVYGPALLALARGEAVTATPPPAAENSYMKAAVATAERVAGNPTLALPPSPVPHVAREADAAELRRAVQAAASVHTQGVSVGIGASAVVVVGLLVLLVLWRRQAARRSHSPSYTPVPAPHLSP